MNGDWRKDYIHYRSVFQGLIANYQKRADLKAYLEVMLSLITISVFTLFALRPTIITIAQLIKDIDAKKATLVQIDKKISDLAQARSLYEAERSKITLLESAIPKAVQPDVFARQVEGLVGSRGVEMRSFAQNEGVIVGSMPAVPDGQQTQSSNQVILPEGALGSNFIITTSVTVDNYQAASLFLTDLEKIRMPAYFEEVRISNGKELENQKLIIFVRGQLPYLLLTKPQPGQITN